VKQLTIGSLFDGIGGFPLAFQRQGFRPCWTVEIDRKAASVTQRHWPDVRQFRDVMGFSRLPSRIGRWTDYWERPNVITAGFPCQDLSVAGKRAGLKGNRSGLFWQVARITNGLRPDFLVWENVPGLLSSNYRRDFAIILRALADIGYFGAWRVLDAQYFGVAQRRRRIFGVFAPGDSGAVRCAEILSLATGMQGHHQTGIEAWEDAARSLAPCLRASGVETERIGGTRGQDAVVVAGSVSAKWPKGSGGPAGDECYNLVAFSCKDSAADAGRLAPTLRSMGHSRSHANAGGQIAIAHSLRGEGFDASEDGTGRGTPLVCGTLGANHGNIKTEPQGARRLTPRECERLQGYPDDWTRWDAQGNDVADGPRYKMLGNSIAVPCVEWLAKRMSEHCNIPAARV
jgi:DNA (cytosine-5)-methyltransferase 1